MHQVSEVAATLVVAKAEMLALGKVEIMENTLVRRDQFNVTPQGIVHKPTDAEFTPSPGDPFLGIECLGQLRNKHPDESGFRTEDVQRMMRELWAEYVAGNPHLFKRYAGGGRNSQLAWSAHRASE